MEQEKKRILGEAVVLKRPENFGSDVDSFDEETDEAEEFANQLAIYETLKRRVNEIDAALEKIGKGQYGICENCKNIISEKLLEVIPESRLCENCKKSKKSR